MGFRSPECLEQRLGLLGIRGVEALGEPGIDRGEQLTSGAALALLPPQADQACGGTQLPGFRLLMARQHQSLLEGGFRPDDIWANLWAMIYPMIVSV